MTDLNCAWEDFCCEPTQSFKSYMQGDNDSHMQGGCGGGCGDAGGCGDCGDAGDSHMQMRKQLKDDLSSSTCIGEECCPPTSGSIYISTKTQIAHLNQKIDLHSIFWKLPIVTYSSEQEGIIKKQMKFNSTTKEELHAIQQKLPKNIYVYEHIISHIENPGGRIPFKDTRKISIGIKNSDITNTRCKKKGAFYNCFVIIIRLLNNDAFKEVHVKVFNTGKLEIPGIKDDVLLKRVINVLICCLSKYVNTPTALACDESMSYTVLINSNFNCGYYVNREKLYDILRNKYKINASYDSCSYPGIQSIFYYNTQLSPDEQTGQQPEDMTGYIKVSFMIFRTGSTLIVGKCDEYHIKNIYTFLVKMFINEYKYISCGRSITETIKKKATPKKKRFIVSITKHVDDIVDLK